MAVILETSLGDLTIDLYTNERPQCCLNFLKLCKVKYYNFALFHSVQRNLVAQTGDPTMTGRGGESVFTRVYGEQARYFESETKPRIKHKNKGMVSMVNNGANGHGSQFFITLADNLDYLDGVHTVFGEVSEGIDVLEKLNEVICDKDHRPYQDVRIFHTIVLDDPYDDPKDLVIPNRSPEPTKEQLDSGRIGVHEEIDDTKGKSAVQVAEMLAEKESKSNALLLHMVGDLPAEDIKPPDNVLFVCKLNPVTTSDDLEIIFSRFGKILSCEVIKDNKTEESLQYAFIEFEKEEDCASAYFKMDNVLIDDRRIHVDFSQSVSKLKYPGFNKKDQEEKVGPQFVIRDKSKRGKNYDLVYSDEEEVKEKHKKEKKKKKKKDRSSSRSRSRSPPRSKKKKHRSRSPSEEKHRKSRHRSRSRSRSGSRSKDRSRKHHDDRKKDRRSDRYSRSRSRSRSYERKKKHDHDSHHKRDDKYRHKEKYRDR